MECPKCKTDNNQVKKFCRVCGTPLGILCDRCATVNGNDDKFCGTCGLPLIPSHVEDNISMGPVGNIPRQYNIVEIEELLSLRKSMEKEKEISQTFSQDDIDDIFK